MPKTFLILLFNLWPLQNFYLRYLRPEILSHGGLYNRSLNGHKGQPDLEKQLVDHAVWSHVGFVPTTLSTGAA